MKTINYYHLLDATGHESTNELGLCYMRKRDQIQLALAHREPGAEERLARLETAYRTLANPRTRAAYDHALLNASRHDKQASAVAAHRLTHGASRSWWVAMLVFAILAAIMVGVSEHLQAFAPAGTVQLEIQRHQDQRPHAATPSTRI